MLNVAQLLEQGRCGDRLDRLTQAHVVGQQHAPAKRQMDHTVLLIAVEWPRKDVERAIALLHLAEEPALLLPHRFDVLLGLQMIVHALIHVDLLPILCRQAVQLAEKCRQALRGLALQHPLGVEVAGQHSAQPLALWQRQGNAHRGSPGVVDVHLGDGRGLGDELLPSIGELAAQVRQHALDVLARANRVGAVIGTGTRVEPIGE